MSDSPPPNRPDAIADLVGRLFDTSGDLQGWLRGCGLSDLVVHVPERAIDIAKGEFSAAVHRHGLQDEVRHRLKLYQAEKLERLVGPHGRPARGAGDVHQPAETEVGPVELEVGDQPRGDSEAEANEEAAAATSVGAQRGSHGVPASGVGDTHWPAGTDADPAGSEVGRQPAHDADPEANEEDGATPNVRARWWSGPWTLAAICASIALSAWWVTRESEPGKTVRGADSGIDRVTVVLFDDSAPPADDYTAKRLWLGEELLPAILAQEPRAVLLDFAYQLEPDELSTLDPLRLSLLQAREAGIPVMAARVASSSLPWCRDDQQPCIAYGFDTSGGHPMGVGAISDWDPCPNGASAGVVVAALVQESWRPSLSRTEPPCPMRRVQLEHVPRDCPPYGRSTTSDIVNGDWVGGLDPFTRRVRQRCPSWSADLTDQVVIVGEARSMRDSYDVMQIIVPEGVVRLSGAEGHAVVALNVLEGSW
jgi:hypothetical protein